MKMLLPLLLSLTVNQGRSASFPRVQEPPGGTACPQTPIEWMAKRDEFAKFLSTEVHKEPTYYENCLLTEEANIRHLDPLNACLTPLVTYAKKLRDSREVKTTLLTSEQQYYNDSAPYVTIPEELQTQKFLKFMKTGNVRSAKLHLAEINRDRNLKGLASFVSFTYESNQQNITEGPGRFLVYDPGNPNRKPNTGKYINFTLPSKDIARAPIDIGVVATHTAESGKAESFFSSYDRSYEDKFDEIQVHRSFSGVTCMQCHFSGGPLGVHPEKPVAKEEVAGQRLVNRSIASTPMSFSSHFDPRIAHVGTVPIHGRTLPDEFWSACTQTSVTTEKGKTLVERLRNATSCSECHGGDQRPELRTNGTLNREFIKSGDMPPENELTVEERKILSRCLSDYYNRKSVAKNDALMPGTLYYYLMSGNCEVQKPGSPPPKTLEPAHATKVRM